MEADSIRKQRLLALAQAGLLHDVGKLYQRGDYRWEDAQFLRPGKREYYIGFAPQFKGQPSHQHVAWSVAFAERYEKCLPVHPSTQLSNPDETAQSLYAEHHREARHPFQRLLRIADWCASGMERTETEESHNFKETPLVTVWDSLCGSRGHAWKIAALRAVGESAFPVPYEECEANRSEYCKLCETLESAMKIVADNPLPTGELRLAALDDILYRHTWCVPSSAFRSEPDVSLYAHSRAVAAIAVALGGELMDDFHQIDRALLDDRVAGRLRFCVIDLAGIQDYIYDMERSGFKGMAKVLRGRSFYVNAILEAVEIALLEQLSLPRVVTLTDGGGKLTLLVPARAADPCRDFGARLEKQLVDATHGRLRIHIGVGKPFGWGKFLEMKNDAPSQPVSALKEYYDSAMADLEWAKFRPLKSVFTAPLIDEWYDGEIGACRACGKMPGKREHPVPDEPGRYYCAHCQHHRTIGERLVKAKVFAFTRHEGVELPVPLGDGVKVHLKILDTVDQKLDTEVLKVFRIDEENGASPWPVRHLANYVPKNDNTVKEFEKIAESGDGPEYLCAVSGDVDNLGSLFKRIWADPKACLAKMMSASRMLNHFFTGVMENELKNKEIYTVYAGGDDFFYIGQWNEVLSEVGEWRKLFKKFVANDEVTFSVGLYISHNHTPVHYMRHGAEEQLDLAKGKGSPAICDYLEPPVGDNGKPHKNRVALWGKVMRWEEDWVGFVVEEAQRLYEWLRNDGEEALTNSALYYRILGYARLAEKTYAGTTNDLRDWLWRPHFLYDLARNVKGGLNEQEWDKSPKKTVFCHFKSLIALNVQNYADPSQVKVKTANVFSTLYRVPLMWALYRKRKKNKES